MGGLLWRGLEELFRTRECELPKIIYSNVIFSFLFTVFSSFLLPHYQFSNNSSRIAAAFLWCFMFFLYHYSEEFGAGIITLSLEMRKQSLKEAKKNSCGHIANWIPLPFFRQKLCEELWVESVGFSDFSELKMTRLLYMINFSPWAQWSSKKTLWEKDFMRWFWVWSHFV